MNSRPSAVLAVLCLVVALCGCSRDDAPIRARDAGPAADASADGGDACGGRLGCACEPESCEGELVCDATIARCRLPQSCEQLECVGRQVCQEAAAGRDARCVEQCEPGWQWSAEAKRCLAEPASCEAPGDDAGAPTRSVAAECEAASRRCVAGDDGGDAFCGGCLPGFVSEGGACRPVRTCDELSEVCAANHRDCEPATDDRDARCAPCPPGSDEMLDGRCLARSCEPGPSNSFAEGCASAHRSCETLDVGARCGSCQAGFAEREDGECEPVVGCAELGCAARHRHCTAATAHGDAECGACRAGFTSAGAECVAIEASSCADDVAGSSLASLCEAEHRSCEAGACAGCLGGYVEDPETQRCRREIDCADCRAAGRTCDEVQGVKVCGECREFFEQDPSSGECVAVACCENQDVCSQAGNDGPRLSCPDSQVCSPAVGNRAASCRRECGERSIWDGQACAPCPPCGRPGETGRPFPTVSAAGECICETEPGYFFSRAGTIGAQPCDADGDGWVRESARQAIDASDPVIRDNARCEVRRVQAFVLVNEQGQQQRHELPSPLRLFESNRNDDDALLRASLAQANLDRGFGDDEHAAEPLLPHAKNLNRLTKLCHLPQSDYNDNGVPDVGEWGEQPPAVEGPADWAVFNRFSYFAELHHAYFDAPNPEAPNVGEYRIVERARDPADEPDPARRVAIEYAGSSDFWRQCLRWRDADFESVARPVGMDFAFDTPELVTPGDIGRRPVVRGMTHHSQFKCLHVVAEPSPDAPQEVSPQLERSQFEINTCDLQSVGGVDADSERNPAAPVFSCRAEPASHRPAVGQLRWAGVRFEPHANDPGGTYRRGCVDECSWIRDGRIALSACNLELGHAQSIQTPLDVACEGLGAEFGRLQCEEVCGDGRDNDDDNGSGIFGDGDAIDEPPAGSPDIGESCATGLGGACAQGRMSCERGAFVCQAPELEPFDYCDGVDNDCDGEVDEDAEVPASSGGNAAGDACDTGAPGRCRAGALVCGTADPNLADTLVCVGEIDPGDLPETCNGLDDDCDGEVDTDGDGAPLSSGSCTLQDDSVQGVCRDGRLLCVRQPCDFLDNDDPTADPELCAAFQCTQVAQPGEREETCNGLDDDCDGQVDEGGVCNCRAYFDWGRVNMSHTGQGDADYNKNSTRHDFEVRFSLGTTPGSVEAEVFAVMEEQEGDRTRAEARQRKTVITGFRGCSNVESGSIQLDITEISFSDLDKNDGVDVLWENGSRRFDTIFNEVNTHLFDDVRAQVNGEGEDDANDAFVEFSFELPYRVQPLPVP